MELLIAFGPGWHKWEENEAQLLHNTCDKIKGEVAAAALFLAVLRS